MLTSNRTAEKIADTIKVIDTVLADWDVRYMNGYGHISNLNTDYLQQRAVGVQTRILAGQTRIVVEDIRITTATTNNMVENIGHMQRKQGKFKFLNNTRLLNYTDSPS